MRLQIHLLHHGLECRGHAQEALTQRLSDGGSLLLVLLLLWVCEERVRRAVAQRAHRALHARILRHVAGLCLDGHVGLSNRLLVLLSRYFLELDAAATSPQGGGEFSSSAEVSLQVMRAALRLARHLVDD